MVWTPSGRSRLIRIPTFLRGWDVEGGAWLTTGLALVDPARSGGPAGFSGYFTLFQPRAGKFGRLQRLGTPYDDYTACGLSNGRVLLAVSSYSGVVQAVYVSNSTGTALDPVSTSALSAPIANIVCPYGSSTLYAGTEDGGIFAVQTASIDGTAWTLPPTGL